LLFTVYGFWLLATTRGDETTTWFIYLHTMQINSCLSDNRNTFFVVARASCAWFTGETPVPLIMFLCGPQDCYNETQLASG
jgi:hypothetical protein